MLDPDQILARQRLQAWDDKFERYLASPLKSERDRARDLLRKPYPADGSDPFQELDSWPPPKQGYPGRPKKLGYGPLDWPLMPELHKLVASGMAVMPAARSLATFTRGQSEYAIAKRLSRLYPTWLADPRTRLWEITHRSMRADPPMRGEARPSAMPSV